MLHQIGDIAVSRRREDPVDLVDGALALLLAYGVKPPVEGSFDELRAGRQLVHLFEIAIFRHLPAVSHMLHDADGIRFDDAHWRIRLQQHAHDGRFGHGFADTRFDCTVRLTAHRRFRKARPVMGKDAGDPSVATPHWPTQ